MRCYAGREQVIVISEIRTGLLLLVSVARFDHTTQSSVFRMLGKFFIL